MENQPSGENLATSDNQSTLNNAQESPKQLTKPNYWIHITMVLLGIIVLCGIFNSRNFQKKSTVIFHPPKQTPTFEPKPTYRPTPTVKNVLSEAIYNYCGDDMIMIDYLPFTLSPEFINKFGILETKDSLECSITESYATGDILHEKNNENDRSSFHVYFYHQGSSYNGPVDEFEPLGSLTSTVINGKKIWLRILGPGPYGVGTHGVDVQLISEKYDSKTGIYVRANGFKSFRNPEYPEIINLVKKYGEKQTDPTFPEYLIRTTNEQDQLMAELVTLASSHPEFIQLTKKLTSALNGVSF